MQKGIIKPAEILTRFYRTNMSVHTFCANTKGVFCENGVRDFAEFSPPRRAGLACAASAQEGRQPAVFHPLMNLPFSLGESGADCRHVTAAKRGTAEDFFYRRGAQCAPVSRHIRSVGYRTATQAVYSTQARHDRVAQLFNVLYRTAPAD